MYDIIFVSKHDRNTAAYDRFKENYPTAKWLPNSPTLSAAIAAAQPMSMTSMYWLITDDVTLDPTLDLTWKPNDWDRQYPHAWLTVDRHGNEVEEFAGVYLIPTRYKLTVTDKQTGRVSSCKYVNDHQQILRPYDVVHMSCNDVSDISHACDRARLMCNTEMYWIIMDDVELRSDMDLNWRPPVWDRGYVHVWQSLNQNGNILDTHTGVYLVPGNYQPDGQELQQGSLSYIKPIDIVASIAKPYDIFFISYHEKNADRDFKRLRDRFPRVQHVSGIKGIHNAHTHCAELSKTPMFWTVDADTLVDASFVFDYRPPDYDKQYLHLWYSRNPVNGLSYGWGAVKLWPTALVREFRSNWLDFTTTVGNIKIIPDIIATSQFNCDRMSTWRSAFRESVKLCHNVANGDHIESTERLMVWLTVANEVEWAQDSLQGARAGVEFYLETRLIDRLDKLKKINDFDWLIKQFDNRKKIPNAPDRSELLTRLKELSDV